MADGLSGWNDSDVQRAGAKGARTAISLSTVLDEIRARGTMGITFSELQAATGRTYNSVGPRVRELKGAGLVVDSGARRRSLLSTKNQVVWEINAPIPGVSAVVST